jgi:hypothetical protein
MSKQPKPTLLANALDSVSPEKLLECLVIWKKKVETEISDYDERRGKIYDVYKRQKDLYDKWLTTPMKKIKKFDSLISSRKKVLIEVEKEINKLTTTLSTPPPPIELTPPDAQQ